MPCAEALRVQAYFDAEIDAVSALEVERHVEQCAECRSLLADLEHMRSAMRTLPAPVMSAELRARLDGALAAEEAAEEAAEVAAEERERRGSRAAAAGRWNRPASFWLGALSGVSVGAAAAALALLLVWMPANNAVLDELVADHVHSLGSTHLIEVESTDQHTVKPWFAGRTDVSPVVVDFAAQGYRLIGGRADYLLGQRTAVVVYAHGHHFIDVFSWADTSDRLPRNVTRRGFHLSFWRAGGVRYCAIADTGWDELGELVRLLSDSAARETAGH
jgi:anti-sigma factor RsiW